MCGICGEVRFKEGCADLAAVQRMLDAMVRRGPDGAGVVSYGPVAFGHRRLKIIDLTECSRQPLVDAHLGLTLVYNGAIYNYRELRAELSALGYSFFSEGDSEVVLKAWHAWGPDALQRFQGMFAFAIHERDRERLVLARDHLGIKPLYWAETDGGVRFASTVPALIRGGLPSHEVDGVALHHYLSFHSVVPAPRTILQAVGKVPPATWIEFDAQGRRIEHTWWKLSFGERLELPYEEQVDLVEDALRKAVRRRLVADVSVGVLLSGGLDSSLITGLLAEEGQRDLETFSVGFESEGGEPGDEFVYSDKVVERFQTRHHKIRVPSSRVLEELPACIRAMSEPMMSHDNIGFHLLSREVAEYVKVVQSGQGADEVFAGYHWYPPLLEAKDGLNTYMQGFLDRGHDDLESLVHPRFRGPDRSRDFVRAHFESVDSELAIDRALHLDTTVMLVEDPVKRVDSQTMAAGLEARVPFLDRELVELAARLPATSKVPDGGKRILKDVGRRVIPHEVIDRPKGYFPVPALKFLRGPFLDLVQESLLSGRARERQVFRPEAIERMLEAPDEFITPLQGSGLWQAAVLELWLQGQDL